MGGFSIVTLFTRGYFQRIWIQFQGSNGFQMGMLHPIQADKTLKNMGHTKLLGPSGDELVALQSPHIYCWFISPINAHKTWNSPSDVHIPFLRGPQLAPTLMKDPYFTVNNPSMPWKMSGKVPSASPSNPEMPETHGISWINHGSSPIFAMTSKKMSGIWWENHLVGGWAQPLWKMMDFVSWDYSSQYMESHKIPWFQTTNQLLNSSNEMGDVPTWWPLRPDVNMSTEPQRKAK